MDEPINSPACFDVALSDRYFDDYRPGIVAHYGQELVTEADVLRFAHEFDPQRFIPTPPVPKPVRSED
jgi:hypothetical protein